jgi:hypothetical protein
MNSILGKWRDSNMWTIVNQMLYITMLMNSMEFWWLKWIYRDHFIRFFPLNHNWHRRKPTVGRTSQHLFFYLLWNTTPLFVRIRVRLPSHPPVCCMRRLNGGGPTDETEKTEVPCHDKDPSLLKGPERQA